MEIHGDFIETWMMQMTSSVLLENYKTWDDDDDEGNGLKCKALKQLK